MFAISSTWRDVMETSALRQDGVVFGRLLVSVPAVGRAVLHDDDGAKPFLQLQYTYWTRLFDDVTYCALNFPFTCVKFTRNAKPHRIGDPAVETVGGALEWWLNGKRFNVNGVAARAPTCAYYWNGHTFERVWRGNDHT